MRFNPREVRFNIEKLRKLWKELRKSKIVETHLTCGKSSLRKMTLIHQKWFFTHWYFLLLPPDGETLEAECGISNTSASLTQRFTGPSGGGPSASKSFIVACAQPEVDRTGYKICVSAYPLLRVNRSGVIMNVKESLTSDVSKQFPWWWGINVG